VYQPSLWLNQEGNALDAFDFDIMKTPSNTTTITAVVDGSDTILTITALHPFTHYALRVNAVVAATDTYARVITGLSTTISIPDTPPQGLQVRMHV
jgi:hypothetical protein